MLMMKLLDTLYLDGYRNLWDKYHDISDLSRAEHQFCVDHFREVKNQLFKSFQFRKCGELKKAYRDNDWNTIYEIILECTEADPAEI